MSYTLPDELQELLLGSTITNIESPTKDESFGRFTVRKSDGRVLSFHFCATELGCWADGVVETTSPGRTVYANVQHVFDEMQECVYADDPEGQEGYIGFEPLEDLLARTFGFRHLASGTEWWLSLKAVRASPWTKFFQTTKGRGELARHMSQHGAPPRPGTEPLATE